MKVIASLLGILLMVLLLLCIGGALVFLIAYGLGLGINLIADFEPYQATVLGFISLAVAGFLANQIWNMVRLAPNTLDDNDYEDDYDDDYDDEFDDEFDDELDDEFAKEFFDAMDEEADEEEPNPFPGIPR